MKYSIIRTCGHVETVVIYGSSKERKNRISIEKLNFVNDVESPLLPRKDMI